MSVLIVEDDARLREFLAVAVRRYGFECDVVGSGDVALPAILSEKYEAVILDLILPGMSGFEVLESLRTTHPHLLRRIIVLTAVSQAALDRQFHSRSLIWEVIPKPFDLQWLMKVVEDCARFHSVTPMKRKELSAWLAERSAAGGAKAALIAVVAEQRELRVHASHGFSQKLLKKHFPIPLTAGYPLCSAARTGRPVWLASLSGKIDYPLLSIWTKSESKAIAAIPLRRNGLVAGVVGWSFTEAQRFDDQQRAYFLDAATDCMAMLPSARSGGYLQISS